MRIFLICPVRGHDPSETQELVEKIEQQGHEVYWPHRDTNQVDSCGLRICEDNRRAIEAADEVVVVWNGESQGCLFDLGMAFALRKPILIEDVPPATRGKSFQNMIRAWEVAGPEET